MDRLINIKKELEKIKPLERDDLILLIIAIYGQTVCTIDKEDFIIIVLKALEKWENESNE